MEKDIKVCCFFGHRKIEEKENLKIKLYEIIENLIVKNNTEVFLFGSKSEFNYLCREVVSKLKEKYPHIKRIYVRAEYPKISNEQEKYFLVNYEATYFPKNLINAGKGIYIKRNYEMIDSSDICIVYYKKDYLPPKRTDSKSDFNYYQPNSGTAIAFNYATQKNKKIINLAEDTQTK